jgi:hypothetical protein
MGSLLDRNTIQINNHSTERIYIKRRRSNKGERERQAESERKKERERERERKERPYFLTAYDIICGS